jgi:hypothetical protein
MLNKYLPASLDAAAVDTLIGLVSGRVQLADAIDAAYHVLGFVIVKFKDNVPTVGADALTCEDSKIALLEKVKESCAVEGSAVGAIDIPWSLVWALVQEIVNKYLKS